MSEIAAFDQANRLWYLEGYTHQAMDLYQQAHQAAPDDPVILFQWARVQWSLGKSAEARRVLHLVREHTDKLSKFGLDNVKRFEKTLEKTGAFRQPLPFAPDHLDVGLLSEHSFPTATWLSISNAAEEREMYGVALFAGEQGQGSLAVPEEARDQWDLIKAAERSISSLNAMRAST